MKKNIKILSFLGFTYGLLILYASLIPFDFNLETDLIKEIDLFWNHWPLNPHSRISGSDVVSNLALYFPLGFFFSLKLRFQYNSVFLSCFTALIICSSLSIFVETAQIFSDIRVASGGDWVLNTISGGTGSLSAGLTGRRIYFSVLKSLKTKDMVPLTAAVPLILLIAADALSPFTPSILLKDIWISLKRSEFHPLNSFLTHPWHWWIVKGVIFSILTMILTEYTRIKKSFKIIHLFIFILGFALILEVSKIFIASRFFKSANIITAFSGSVFGFSLFHVFFKKADMKNIISFLIIFLIFYIYYLAWIPFNFRFDPFLIKSKLPSLISMIPLYDYAMGASLEHARLFIQALFLNAAIVFMIRLRFPNFDNLNNKIAVFMIFTSVLGLIQETGQFLLPSRTPSFTDIYSFAAGGAMGAFFNTRIPEIDNG